MKTFVLIISLAFAQSIQAAAYCDDPAVIADWDNTAKKYSHSDNWQQLHAVWLGLCQKVRDGSISQGQAASIFEEERARIKLAEWRKVRVRVDPFG